MPKFAYVAEGLDGAVVSGVHLADSLPDARGALLQQYGEVTKLVQKRSVLEFEISRAKVKRAELMHLSRQLAAFIRAGVPILDSISMLAEETDSRAVQRTMGEINQDLRSGATLADAVDSHPADFPPFYRGILRSAELTGNLDTVLAQLSLYLERDLEARRKIKSAILYPAIVLTMAFVTVIVLAVWVLPKFQVFFESLDATLPLPTRMLMGTTSFLTSAWPLLLLAVALLASVIGGAGRVPSGRLLRDRLLLRLPVLGETLQYALIERFCRILASMVSAGVPLDEAMVVAKGSLNNRHYEQRLSEAHDAMLQGEGLAGPIQRTKLFPGTATQMIRVGEETGSLDTQLTVAASYFEVELDYKIKKVTSLIEPAVILISGGVVGFVAIALVSAMYGIFNQVKL